MKSNFSKARVAISTRSITDCVMHANKQILSTKNITTYTCIIGPEDIKSLREGFNNALQIHLNNFNNLQSPKYQLSGTNILFCLSTCGVLKSGCLRGSIFSH